VRSRFADRGSAILERSWLVIAMCLAGPCCQTRPATAEVIVETSVDRDTVTIADPVIFAIDILAPPGVEVQAPPPDRQLGPFEVRDVQILPPDEPAGEPRHTRILWTLVPFQTGPLEIPSVTIVATDTSGASDTLRTREEFIQVASLEPDLQGDIRDIKPPEELPGGRAWIGWLIGGLILTSAGLWLLRFLRRRRLRRDLEAIPYQGPPRPADRIALEELNRIAALQLMDKGLIKELYIQVCDVIRRYIEGRYAIGAMELTTWELIEELERTAVPRDHRGDFRSFLQECDLVKFAKHIPPAEVCETLLHRARQLVLSTRISLRPPLSEKIQDVPTGGQPAGVPRS